MKIGQPSDNPVSVSTSAQSAPAKGSQSASASATTAAAGPQAPGVAVTVSTLARTLEASKRGDTADVDMKKVDAVRSAIQNGTYVVNAEAVADKLLSNAQEMLNRTRA